MVAVASCRGWCKASVCHTFQSQEGPRKLQNFFGAKVKLPPGPTFEHKLNSKRQLLVALQLSG